MEPNTQPNNSPASSTPSNTSIPPVNIPIITPENKSSIGSIIGTVIVIALIILGGLYFWGKRIDEAKLKQDLVSNEEEASSTFTEENMEANAIMSVSGSDDLVSIEAELKATNLDNLGAELGVVAE